MAQIDSVFTQFLAGSKIGRTSNNTGQNERYFRIEMPPSGNDSVMEYINGNVVQGRIDAQELIANDWIVVV